MTPRERRLREQAQRGQLILTTAREMAEAEGWDSVTTRRLAERIEYSQPVLYQHFKNKEAIVHGVALEGFAELAAALRAARTAVDRTAADRRGGDPRAALDAVARAYVDFAARGPVLYQAMLTLDVGLAQAGDDTPQPLLDTFDAIREAVAPVAGDRDPDLLAEILWSAWHGLAALSWGKRLRPGLTSERLAALTDLVTDVRQRS